MTNFKFFISLLFLTILQVNIFCQIEPEEINLGDSKPLSLTKDNSFNAYFYLEYSEKDFVNGNILVISTTPDIYLSPAYIYTSFDQKNPSSSDRQFSSQDLGKNNLFINSSKLKKYTKLYFNIHSLKESNIKLEVYLKNEIYISPDEKKVKFKISDLTQIYFSLKNITTNKILFYSLGENINYFSMKVEYDSDGTKKEFLPSQKFENGYGIIINLNDLDKKDTSNFIITLIPTENYSEKKVEVGFDFVDQNYNNKIEIQILDHIYGSTENGLNCYQIKNVDNKKNATMLLNIYNQAITFMLMNNEVKKYSLDVFNNYFIKLPKEYSESENYFCFKKFTPKEKEEEELGEISYDFQIYYEDDLQEIQSFIMPLINGKVYTHSLNSGDIFIYRHNTFSNKNSENKIYSANLLSIRGKPHMYGYSCKTFPECNLDETKFNELKERKELDIIAPISQYYVNKKENAIGNIEKDINNDPVSEIKEQYLTIVKCESNDDYPNHGECKYAIEINNELDEVQLAPEIVYATSVISPKNYFNIRISDYKNIKYFNIFFTVLTGNADIYLYEDKNYQNLVKKYNFRHVHKKQIIEITEEFKENYYIEIRSTDNSFIELKYETDFYNRGYTRMNPNEINIEYVNKKNNFMPFEIHNPDYFYPINNTLNNDFYFTIKTLDCSMTYKYNFIDFVNITSIHHEVEKDDINFGSSFAFMLKVENYFHKVKDDTEDCAMIIYTGEKSESTPLLLISDMPHPSNFTNSYYIYPFIYNKDFNGIFIDIKFDYEMLLEIEGSPLIEVTIKIGDQKEEDFIKYNLKKDYTIFIKNEAEKFCTNNLQCSLFIGIKKIFLENKTISPYIIKTNVYNAAKSPEYIYKNKVYNYKLLQNGSKYFYTQVDLDEEGEINFIFNKGNAKIFAKLIEKNKIEENFNWNNRVKLPDFDDNNLLTFNPTYGVLKYSKENTKICEVGCELYIQIKSDEKTNLDTEFTEVSFSINNKNNNIVEMRLDNYIKGSFNKNELKYYTIIIPEDYKKISLNLYSPYGKAYIKVGNETISSKDNFDWELNTKSGFGRCVIDCKNEKINKDSLKGVIFSIGITNNDNLPEGELNNYLYYYLEVQTLFNNDKIYYHLTNERSIICDTEEDNFCHVLLNLNHYYSNKNNLIYALPLLNNKANIKMYSKFYTQNDMDGKLFSDSIQDLFPKNDSYSQFSNNNILKLDPESINQKEDNYILLTIESENKNSLIKLVFNGGITTQSLLPYNTDKLYILDNNKLNLFLEENINGKTDNYILNLKTIEGNAILNVNKENYNINGNYYQEIEVNKEGFNIENNKVKNQASIILLNYEKKYNNRLYQINVNDKNEIYLPFSEEVFPQYLYTKLNNAIQIEVLLHDIEYKTNNNEDLFNINSYIINEKELNSLIINPKKDLTKDIIPGYYLKYEKTGIINISSEKIKTDDNYYLFLVVEKNENNKNIYNKIKTQYSVNNKIDNEEMILFSKKYYFSSLAKPSSLDYYLLKKDSINDKYIIIDIAENIPVKNNFDTLVNLYPDNTNNETLIFDYNGRKRLIVDLKDQEGVKLWINKNDLGDENYKNYSIIYYSLNNLNEFDNYTNFNNSIIINNNNKENSKSKLLINNIKNSYDFIKDVTYNVDIFKLNNEFDNKIYDTIYVGNRDENNIEKSLTFKSNEKDIYIDIDYNKNDLKDKFIVRIVANIVKKDGSNDKYIYNSKILDFEKEEEENNNYVWIFILIPIVIILILVIFILCLRKRKLKNIEDTEKEVNEADTLLQEKSEGN